MIKDNYIIQYTQCGVKQLQYEMASCAEGREAKLANNCMPGLQEATQLCERAKHGSELIIICVQLYASKSSKYEVI